MSITHSSLNFKTHILQAENVENICHVQLLKKLWKDA